MTTTLSPDPRVATGSLVICGTCHLLRGRVPGRHDGAEQLCDCAPPELREGQPQWGGDFNTYAELCRCCGLVLLRSGSRWSVWFCETCRPLVVALNGAIGHRVIPIGRHSLMNGVGARAEALRTRRDREDFVDRVRGLFGRIDALDAYRRVVIRRNLVALGFDPEVDLYLGKYLWTVRRSDLTPQDAFAVLAVDTLVPAATA